MLDMASVVLTLNVVTDSLTADNDIVIEDSNLAPSRTLALRWKTAHVLHLAILEDLDECSTGELAHNGKLAAVCSPPAPRRASPTFRATHVGMAEEVVKVHLLLVSIVAICCRLDILTFLQRKVWFALPASTTARPSLQGTLVALAPFMAFHDFH